MQAVLKKRFGVDAKLIPGHGGTYVVTVDGKEVFSKHKAGRFPEEREILESVADLAK